MQPFVRRLSGKAIPVSEEGLKRWVASKRAAYCARSTRRAGAVGADLRAGAAPAAIPRSFKPAATSAYGRAIIRPVAVRVRSGDEVTTAGLTFDDREALGLETRRRIEALLGNSRNGEDRSPARFAIAGTAPRGTGRRSARSAVGVGL